MLTVKGQNYRTGKLDARTQFHISRRLGPMVAAAGITVMAMRAGLKVELMDFLPVAGPVADVLAAMSDEEVDYVLHTCMAVVEREDPTTHKWAPVMSGARFMYEDIDMPAMVRLVVEVLKDNLGNFLTELGEPATSPSS